MVVGSEEEGVVKNEEDGVEGGAVAVVNDDGKKKDTTVFPPPPSWYKSSIGASRDDMWAYCATGVIVLVRPPPQPHPIIASENGIGQGYGDRERWPSFSLIGPQLDKYLAISFCQSSWDYLPLPGAPLVSGCGRGIVRVWNVEDKSTVIYHETHLGHAIAGLDWSPSDHHTIYAIDDTGTMSVWNVVKNSTRSMNFGKIVPSCLKASPYEKDVVCFGTKGGNVFIVDVTGNSGKIIAKARHDEEVTVTNWMPPGDWNVLKLLRTDSKAKLPMLVSSIHSVKLPTIRIWNELGHDIGMLQSWDKDTKSRPYKMFGIAVWAKDPNSGNLMLISTGRYGEVLAWTDGLVHDILHRAHAHNAIFSFVQCGDVLWSLSYEPMIVGWNLRTMEVECIIPTFKGACTIAPSPVDSARLAIGGTDSVIRILKCVTGYPKGDACTKGPLVTNKLKGKVTAITWHPTKDNCIAFGTDEGILGIFELRGNNRYPVNFDRRVDGTVYTVVFGPSTYEEGYVRPTPPIQEANGIVLESKETEKESLMLYACGGHNIVMINPSRNSNPIINVGRIIEKSNPQISENIRKGQTDKMTEVKWTPDYSFMAVGYNDGRIEVYSAPHLKMKCWIKCHQRAIQFLAWRPFDFSVKNPGDAKSEKWLASASNDGSTRLYNLAALFNKSEEVSEEKENESESASDEPLMIISSEATLQGHGIRVISCAWSPHDKNLIVTVAYDCTAIIWNIEDGSHVARYMDHQHRLVACSFHPTDPYKLITLSDEQSSDFSVHMWDYREHPFRKTVAKGGGRKPAHPIKSSNDSNETIDTILLAVNDASSHKSVEIKDHGDSKIHAVKANNKVLKSKSTKPKSLLPLTSNGLINSKLSIVKELGHIIDKKPIEVDNSCATGDNPSVYLGILGNPKECVNMLRVERDGHDSKKNLEQAAILSTWMGDKHWVEQAIKNRQVTENMLHIAAFFSRKLYNEAMTVFAEQLVDKEEYAKASTFYFMLGNLDQAVKVLVDQALFREAVSLMKSNVPEDDPRLQSVIDKWADRAISDGNYELASKIYCSVGQHEHALIAIEKRNHPYAHEAGCYISSKIGNESFSLTKKFNN